MLGELVGQASGVEAARVVRTESGSASLGGLAGLFNILLPLSTRVVVNSVANENLSSSMGLVLAGPIDYAVIMAPHGVLDTSNHFQDFLGSSSGADMQWVTENPVLATTATFLLTKLAYNAGEHFVANVVTGRYRRRG